MGALSDRERLFYEANGYLTIPGALDADLVARLRAVTDEAMERFRRNPDLPGSRLPEFLEVEAIMEYHQDLFDLVEHRPVFARVREIVGGDVAVIDHAYYLTPPGSVVTGSAWHTDVGSRIHGVYHPRSTLMVRAMIALGDVGADDGATLVVPGSHRFTADVAIPRVEVPEDMPGAVRLTCRAGDAYLFNGNLLHCPGNNRGARDRRMVLFNYGHRWMRMWKGHEPSAWLAARCTTPMRRQLLGLGRGYYGNDAAYDPG